MKWLITAFEPFNGAAENSSLQALHELQKRKPDPRLEFFSPVSVTFARAWPQVKERIDQIGELRGVLCLGQAEGRKKISLERLALNCIDANIRDNDGHLGRVGKIKSGPDLIWSNIPWEEYPLSTNIERSYSAGTFVCNALMFELMEWAETQQKLAGFVHIPLLDSRKADVVSELESVMEFILKL